MCLGTTYSECSRFLYRGDRAPSESNSHCSKDTAAGLFDLLVSSLLGEISLLILRGEAKDLFGNGGVHARIRCSVLSGDSSFRVVQASDFLRPDRDEHLSPETSGHAILGRVLKACVRLSVSCGISASNILQCVAIGEELSKIQKITLCQTRVLFLQNHASAGGRRFLSELYPA